MTTTTKPATVACACGCGQVRRLYDRDGKPHRFVHGHNTKLEIAKDKEKLK